MSAATFLTPEKELIAVRTIRITNLMSRETSETGQRMDPQDNY